MKMSLQIPKLMILASLLTSTLAFAGPGQIGSATNGEKGIRQFVLSQLKDRKSPLYKQFQTAAEKDNVDQEIRDVLKDPQAIKIIQVYTTSDWENCYAENESDQEYTEEQAYVVSVNLFGSDHEGSHSWSSQGSTVFSVSHAIQYKGVTQGSKPLKKMKEETKLVKFLEAY
jgi:hypothetical protein